MNYTAGFLKIIYFDVTAAQDYLDITHGGRLDWNKKENKEKIGKLLIEVEAEVGGGFNILNFFKGGINGKIKGDGIGKLSSIFEEKLKNSLLVDYIKKAEEDKRIVKFDKRIVYAPKDSITQYKMLSSYLNVVPENLLPFSTEKLNKAVLGERGYYGMFIRNDDSLKSFLRFNIDAFRNNYNLADLCKMELTYYGVLVGTCKKSEVSIKNEFNFQKEKPSLEVEDLSNNEDDETENLNVYDIVLAGVEI